MGTLYLVRHGQASFGAQDYDQLSAVGQRQCVGLGEYFRQRDLAFSTVLTGTLRRHAQSYAGICLGARASLPAMPWPGLDEFDSPALIATVHPGPLARPDTPELYRNHFRLLRDALTLWMKDLVSPQGMPNYQDFKQGVINALEHVRQHCDGNVLLVSSGGPIATAVGYVLDTSPETTIELNMRLRNSAVSEFTFNPKRHTLLTFNTLPHLGDPSLASSITYA
jgi:broad specificity phosphatase PhoE